MRIRNVLFISATMMFAFNFTRPVHADSADTATIAIIADKASNLDRSPLVSLLEAQLSQTQSVKLLERAAIDKVLEEQRLSAAGLLDRSTTIKIGKLLRADAFIILSLENHSQDANDLIRVRLAETAHGLRLLDYFEQLNSMNPLEAVARIIQKTQSVLEKINQPDTKLIPVGIVDIHRVQLGEQYKMLERTLPVMLSVRLSREPQIIMLEREDLKVLFDEKLMTEGEGTKFWNSAVLIEGYLQPNNGHLEIHIQLKQADGHEIMSLNIPFEPNEPSKATARAANEIIQKLQNSPPIAQWKPELEAAEFYKQGQMLAVHGRYEDALPIFETAHALQTQNVYYTGALFERLWEIRRNIESRNKISGVARTLNSDVPSVCPYTDMELAELVSILVHQIRDGFNRSLLSALDLNNTFAKSLGNDFVSLGYFSSSVSADTEKIKLINQENRRIWCETFTAALKKQLIRIDYPQLNNLIQARLVWISSCNPKELLNNLKKAFTEFVLPPEMGGEIKSANERESLFRNAYQFIYALPDFNYESTHLKGVSKEFLRLWQQYIESMADIENPYLNREINLLIAKGIPSLMDDTEKSQTQNESIQKANELLNKLTNSNNILTSEHKLEIIHNISPLLRVGNFPIKYIGSFDERRLIWEKIFEFLIKQKDIDCLIVIGAYAPFSSGELLSHPDINLRRYQFLNEIIKLIQTHEGDIKITNALARLKDIQAEIKQSYPDLKSSATNPNIPITMLLKKENGLQLFQPALSTIVQDKMLWIAMVSRGGSGVTDDQGNVNWTVNVGLAGIDLEQKRTTTLWQTKYLSPNPVRMLTGLLVNEKASYLSLLGGGIVEFPGSTTNERAYLSNPKVFTQEDGLPSFMVTSIAQNARKLWVAYGDRYQESGLVLYDPKTEQWETVFCSTMKENSPFNAGVPYQINSMAFIKPEMIYFAVSGIEQSGLWKIDINTQELKYIRHISGELSKDTEGNFWLTSTSYLYRIDSDKEEMTLIIRDALTTLNRYRQKRELLFGLKEDMFLPESFLSKVSLQTYQISGSLDLSTGTIYKNKLWARYGKSQILIVEKGKSFEDAQIIDNNILDGGPVLKFVSTPYGLVGIGEGTVGLIDTESMEKSD